MAACQICDHPDRYDLELAYMTGERRAFPVSRATIERHMSHVTEPEALRLALGMSATVALAARLRNLESQATTILDLAMTPDPDTKKINAALGLKAVREVRATIELMGRVAGTLIDRVERADDRPDIDKRIEEALAAKGQVSAPEPAAPHFDSGQTPQVPMLALPPAPEHKARG